VLAFGGGRESGKCKLIAGWLLITADEVHIAYVWTPVDME